MFSVHKFIQRKKSSEQGFVLIFALMAITVLIAIGFFALTIISGDLMIVSRMTCERKAFSAAESGAHAVFTILDLNNIGGANVTDVHFDPDNPDATYSATTNPTNERISVEGFDTSSMSQVFETVVTGACCNDSWVSIIIGVTSPPREADTLQGKL